MKFKINSYIAIFCVTIAGAGAALLIVHVATNNAFAATVNGNEANYASLQQEILNP